MVNRDGKFQEYDLHFDEGFGFQYYSSGFL